MMVVTDDGKGRKEGAGMDPFGHFLTMGTDPGLGERVMKLKAYTRLKQGCPRISVG